MVVLMLCSGDHNYWCEYQVFKRLPRCSGYDETIYEFGEAFFDLSEHEELTRANGETYVFNLEFEDRESYEKRVQAQVPVEVPELRA